MHETAEAVYAQLDVHSLDDTAFNQQRYYERLIKGRTGRSHRVENGYGVKCEGPTLLCPAPNGCPARGNTSSARGAPFTAVTVSALPAQVLRASCPGSGCAAGDCRLH